MLCRCLALLDNTLPPPDNTATLFVCVRAATHDITCASVQICNCDVLPVVPLDAQGSEGGCRVPPCSRQPHELQRRSSSQQEQSLAGLQEQLFAEPLQQAMAQVC